MNNGPVQLPTGGVTVVLGAQWGDEGKGKLVDVLCENADIVARCQGGNNAGHTIVVGDIKYDFHILPSGLVNPRAINLIGSGCVVHIPSFFEELEAAQQKGLNTADRLFLSDRCHLVFDIHQICDGLKEAELGGKSIGTTKKGIGPAYSSKASRSGIRVHHLFDWEDFERRFRGLVVSRHKRYGEFEYDVEAELEYAEKLRDYVVDAVAFMQTAINAHKRILCEGANAIMLDIDFGTYPYVTSSSTSIGGVCTGLGIPPQRIGNVIGVVKAYSTRVGAGPFPTEQLNEIGTQLQEAGHECGTTTGRKRRCGWLDAVQLRYSNQINGYTSVNLTKLDVLDGLDEIKIGNKYSYEGNEIPYFPADLKVLEKVEVEYITLKGWKTKTSECTLYTQLPIEARRYVETIEQLLRVKIEWVGIGPGRDRMLTR